MTAQIQLADILESYADAFGPRRAVVAGDDERTYAQLDERATRLAHHLAAEGVVSGDHVAVHARNCVEWIESFYACFKISAVPINVNYRYVETELRYLYEDSDSVAVIVAPEFVPAVEGIADALPEQKTRLVIGEDYDSAIAAASPERDFHERSGDDRYLVYTGGTTGMPKGVVWRQEDLVLGAMNAYRRGAPIPDIETLTAEAAAADPVVLMTMGPFMHGGSQWAMGCAHLVGGTYVMYCEPRFDAEKVLEIAAHAGVQRLSLTGDAMGKPLAERLLDDSAPPVNLPELAGIGNGAAPLTPGVRDLFRKALPGLPISDGYGASEIGSAGHGSGHGSDGAPRFTVGPDTTVLTEDLEQADVGVVGLLARSGHVPIEYYKDPDKTAATFPTIDGRRWVVPGDFARREDDGTISLLGRGSGSINSGGEKIFPEEVESALMQHRDVDDVAVVGTPHDRWGQQVTALVRTRRPTLSADDLRATCKEHLADYKAPKTVLFVEEVPRTNVGKVDYKAVRDLAVALIEDRAESPG